MGLFQKSVLKKYKNLQDQNAIEKAFKKFVKYFHNPEIQQNIRESKEEQYQEGFLRELFVNIFDYTINPNPNFNLTTELKNEKGAKKADGAILKDGKAIAVIELKGTKTKDLESIRQQAFDYKANQSNCEYVITSNFEKLRFYIQNAIDFEEFNLFTLDSKQFELLYICLHKDNLLQDIPLKIKTDSLVEEEEITKKLYKDYSLFKRELFRDLVKKNMKNEIFRSELLKEDQTRAIKNIKLSLFKKSQKLIDRFLFIFFAEDKSLLPPNSTMKILSQWRKLQELDAYVPLYDRFKLYFKYLDQGRKGTNGKDEIFAYNGGLFKSDPILDSLVIDDNLLFEHTKTLSTYNFESQVSVNILGHIFENSLNEIESINAEIEGEVFDKQKTKRKKDGVFYTPKYITKYIVDNTVGKLCAEKKQLFNLKEEEYHKSRKGRKTEVIKKLKNQLDNYRNWLLKITILDPACGSGAFLNQALDFLINEHKYIDELETSLLGGGIVFQNIENTILENNIFGVDLNEESVEIAKLSLWLRTAQPRRKLNSLNNNIKCGNSLIDDPKVAGDKAFIWQKEFVQIFKNGGFDVVIGNPPYGAGFSKTQKEYYISKYNLSASILDTYLMFLIEIPKYIVDNGILGYIIPSTWLYMSQYKKFRELLLSNYELPQIIHYRNPIFEDATVETCISFLKNTKPKTHSEYNYQEVKDLKILNNTTTKQLKLLKSKELSFLLKNQKNQKLFDKISRKSKNLESISKVVCGLTPYRLNKGKPKQTPEIVKGKLFDAEIKVDDTYRQYLMGRDFNRYVWKIEKERWISYGDWLAEPRYAAPFDELEKIVVRQTSDRIIAHIDKSKFLSLKNVHNIKIINEKIEYKYLLTLLNSNLIDWWYHQLIPEVGRVFAEVKVVNLKKLPIKETSKINQQSFIDKADIILSLSERLQQKSNKFLKRTKEHFEIEKVSKKLSAFYNFDFKIFVAELRKQKVVLSLIQQDEWQDYFDTYKIEINQLQFEIQKIDNEIDRMVYELYELTEEEINIVENANA